MLEADVLAHVRYHLVHLLGDQLLLALGEELILPLVRVEMLAEVQFVENLLGFVQYDLLCEVDHGETHAQDDLYILGGFVLLIMYRFINASVHNTEAVLMRQNEVHDLRSSGCYRKIVGQLIHIDSDFKVSYIGSLIAPSSPIAGCVVIIFHQQVKVELPVGV